MPLSEEDIALIENYLDGNLSNQEKTLFDLRMKEQDFKDEVALRNSIAKGIEEFHRTELRDELKRHLSKIEFKTSDHSRNINWYMVAASMILILAVGWILFRTTKHDNAETLFVAYYKPFPVSVITRGESETTIPAFEKYREGKYRNASVLLLKIISENSKEVDQAMLRLLLGNCYLNTGKFDHALQTFQEVIDSRDLVLTQHAQWYIALTHLKLSETVKALDELNQIAASNSAYAKRAKELKTRLAESVAQD